MASSSPVTTNLTRRSIDSESYDFIMLRCALIDLIIWISYSYYSQLRASIKDVGHQSGEFSSLIVNQHLFCFQGWRGVARRTSNRCDAEQNFSLNFSWIRHISFTNMAGVFVDDNFSTSYQNCVDSRQKLKPCRYDGKEFLCLSSHSFFVQNSTRRIYLLQYWSKKSPSWMMSHVQRTVVSD